MKFSKSELDIIYQYAAPTKGRWWYCLTAAVHPPGAALPGCPSLPVYTSRRQRRLVHWAELH